MHYFTHTRTHARTRTRTDTHLKTAKVVTYELGSAPAGKHLSAAIWLSVCSPRPHLPLSPALLTALLSAAPLTGWHAHTRHSHAHAAHTSGCAAAEPAGRVSLRGVTPRAFRKEQQQQQQGQMHGEYALLRGKAPYS